MSLCLGYASLTQADIYKSVDADGHVTYSSTPSKGAKKLDSLLPLSHTPQDVSSSPSRPHISSPSDFPKVDTNTQKGRDVARRKILTDELVAEENQLAEARINLSQAESARRDAKTDAKLHSLQDELTNHEKNIRALKTELSNIK